MIPSQAILYALAENKFEVLKIFPRFPFTICNNL